MVSNRAAVLNRDVAFHQLSPDLIPGFIEGFLLGPVDRYFTEWFTWEPLFIHFGRQGLVKAGTGGFPLYHII